MIASVIMNLTAKISDTVQKKLNPEETSKKNIDASTTIDGGESNTFRLPIHYLDPTEVYSLNETVANDLELSVVPISDESHVESDQQKTMYHYLFKPKNEFAENMIQQWRTSFTTNTEFLGETQQVITSMDDYKIRLKKTVKTPPEFEPNYKTIMQIWNDTKEDPNFLERYSYMEIDMFKHVNKMPSFLQATSIVNMGSPILSFLIPFILFLFPFIILKIQGIPITFSVYLTVLKEISRNHFIGKMLSNAQEMSIQNFIYIIILIGLYVYQIYQNYMACMRFYKNISRINEQICYMQDYLDYSISSMESFCLIIKQKAHYAKFHQAILTHLENLRSLQYVIQSVRPFQPSFSKITEIGVLLQCYYELHSNKEYERSLKYSFQFEGFIQNLCGIFENLQSNKIGFADYYSDISGNSMEIKDQYYPALVDETYIVNDATLDKNMIITGPNASGKTTFLKTTTLNVIFSQQFGCGFYSTCKMKPYTNIHSYLNIPDTSGRDSLFQAESRRCKEIIDTILSNRNNLVDSRRHFCIFDELYSGTNPVEASKSAYSFLLYLSKFENVDFILTTHYMDICNRLKTANEKIENWKMDAELDETSGDISYRYTISLGISNIQGAIKVLRDMEYPAEILQTIYDYDVIESIDSEEIDVLQEETHCQHIQEEPIQKEKKKRGRKNGKEKGK